MDAGTSDMRLIFCKNFLMDAGTSDMRPIFYKNFLTYTLSFFPFFFVSIDKVKIGEVFLYTVVTPDALSVPQTVELGSGSLMNQVGHNEHFGSLD